jgi:hypothetical protein
MQLNPNVRIFSVKKVGLNFLTTNLFLIAQRKHSPKWRNSPKAETDVRVLKIFFAQKCGKKWRVLFKILLGFLKLWIPTLLFKKNANFLPKIGKIAENCDHNIDLLI